MKFLCRAVQTTRKVILRKEETTVGRHQRTVSDLLNSCWKPHPEHTLEKGLPKGWELNVLQTCLLLSRDRLKQWKGWTVPEMNRNKQLPLKKKGLGGGSQRDSSPMTRRKTLCDIYVINLVWCEMLNAKVYLLERKGKVRNRSHISKHTYIQTCIKCKICICISSWLH